MFAQTLRADLGMNNQNPEMRAEQVARWCRDRGNCALVGMAAYVLVYLLWLASGWGSARTIEIVVEFGLLPVLLLGVVFSIRAIRATSGERQSQQAWALIGAGIVMLAIADGMWAWYAVVSTSAPFPSLADAFFIGSKFVLIAGILRFPAPDLTRSDYVRYVLDAGIILLGVTTLVGYLVIRPENLLGPAFGIESALLFAYPAVGLMLLIAALIKMHRRPRPGRLGLLSLIVVSAVAMTTADFVWVFEEARGTYDHGGITYALWMIGYAFLAASPQRQVDVISRNVPLMYPNTVAAWIRSALSYLAAGMAVTVFALAAAPRLIDEFGVLLGLLALLIVLVAVRQFQALRENQQYEIAQVRHESDARINALVEYSSDMIAVLDNDLRFRFQSPVAQELTGATPEAFVGTRVFDWSHADDRPVVRAAMKKLLRGDEREMRFEWRLAGPEGNVVYLESIASNELETPGVQGIVLNSRDISERKSFERELAHQAYHDPLTGLPNRARVLEFLGQELRQSRLDRKTALMFIDLDRFKPVNDTLGHDAGDELLKQVAERFDRVLRENDTLARFAGDEFVVLLPAVTSHDAVLTIARRLGEQLDTPFDLAGTRVSISSSTGVAIADSSNLSPAVLLRQADAAMYAAKRNGRNRFELYEPWMESELNALDDQRALELGRLSLDDD